LFKAQQIILYEISSIAAVNNELCRRQGKGRTKRGCINFDTPSSSTRKKGMFSNTVRPLLVASSASSRMEKRVISEKSQHSLSVRLMVFLPLSIFL
ncbi:hypothetical protein, partial [Prevotella jejuni]